MKYKWLRMKVVYEAPLTEILPPEPRPQVIGDAPPPWSSSEIVHLSLSHAAGLLGIVLANGMAAVAQLGDSKVALLLYCVPSGHLTWMQTKVKMTGEWLSATNAVCMAFNAKHNLLAVGFSECVLILHTLSHRFH